MDLRNYKAEILPDPVAVRLRANAVFAAEVIDSNRDPRTGDQAKYLDRTGGGGGREKLLLSDLLESLSPEELLALVEPIAVARLLGEARDARGGDGGNKKDG